MVNIFRNLRASTRTEAVLHGLRQGWLSLDDLQDNPEVSWALASCGPRVRVPTACAGCTWNPNGLADTQKMCREVDKRFLGEATHHHKFKVDFSGCPVDSTRTREMDLGFQGIAEPQCLTELCTLL